MDYDDNFVYLKKDKVGVVEGRINRGSLGAYDSKFVVEKFGERSKLFSGKNAEERIKRYLGEVKSNPFDVYAKKGTKEPTRVTAADYVTISGKGGQSNIILQSNPPTKIGLEHTENKTKYLHILEGKSQLTEVVDKTQPKTEKYNAKIFKIAIKDNPPMIHDNPRKAKTLDFPKQKSSYNIIIDLEQAEKELKPQLDRRNWLIVYAFLSKQEGAQ